MTNLDNHKISVQQEYVIKLEDLITRFNEHFDVIIKKDTMFRVYFIEDKQSYIITYFYGIKPTDSIDNNCFHIVINLSDNTITHKKNYEVLFTSKMYGDDLIDIVKELYSKYCIHVLQKKKEKYLDRYYNVTLLNIFNTKTYKQYKSLKDIDWEYETEHLPMDLVILFKDYLDWNNLCYNPNLSFEFILEYIENFDMARLVYFSEGFTDEQIAKIPKSYIDNIDKDVIMGYLLDDINANGVNNMLDWIEYLAKFKCIDWNKLTSKIHITQEFITKFNKYWSNEHIIVKSIKVNHN